MNNRSEQAMSECRAKLAAATEAERSGDIKGADALGAEAANKAAAAIGLDRRDQDFGAISLAEKRAERVREGMELIHAMNVAKGRVA